MVIKLKSVLFTALAAICLSIVINSCSTDVDLLAPYKSTPVVIGILDYKADTQFVRINRTYLGEGDATIYAQIKDSVEYNPSEVEAWLYKKRNGNLQDSIQLQYIVKPSRDPGVFYNQDVGFYYTTEELFDTEEVSNITNAASGNNTPRMSYELKVVARGETFTAETDFPNISNGTIIYPLGGPTPVKLDFYSPSFGSYRTVNLRYNMSSGTGRYLGVFRMNFDYVTTDGNTVTDQFVDYNLGAQDNSENNSRVISLGVNGENWFAFIGPKIKAIPNISQVRIRDVEFRLTGANDILNAYLKAANPVSEFTPVLTTVSNIDNGAIGILGSRTRVARSAQLLDNTVQIMNEGEYTSAPGLTYCVIDWAGSNYVCNP